MYPYKKFIKPSPYRTKQHWLKTGNTLYFLITSFLGVCLIGDCFEKRLFLLIYSLCVLKREDILHREIHKTDSIFTKYQWFLIYRNLHKEHHKGNMKQNYGFGDMFHDWVCGTLSITF